MVKVTGLAERLVETAKAFRSEYRPELLYEPQRAARGYLSIEKLTQYHEMVEPSLIHEAGRSADTAPEKPLLGALV